MKRIISILFALALVLGFSLVATTPVAAATILVPPGVAAINTAVLASSPGDILQLVPGGLYIEWSTLIPHDLTIMGLPGPKPVIQPANPLQADGAGSAWFLINPGVTFVMQDVILDGTPQFVHQAIRNHGTATIQNVDFLNFRGAPGSYKGVGIQSYGGTVSGGAGSDTHGGGGLPSTLTVTGCTFQGMGRIGVLVKGTLSTATISGCTYTGKGNSPELDYGVEVGAGGQATILGNTITSCGLSGSGWGSAGILVTTYYGVGTTAFIWGNTLTNNEYGIAIGYDAADTSVVTAHFNNMSGSITAGADSTSGTLTTDATCNWWGAADGPQPGGSGDLVSGSVDPSSWLTEPYAFQKSVAAPGGTASFTSTSGGSIEGLTAMAPPATPPVTLPYGMFNFTICCFTGPGVTLNIVLPGPVPVGTKWYKYNGGSWDALPIGDDNGDAFITVTLTDNNPIHDEDPTVGQIIDQGGPGYPGGALGWETYPISKGHVLLPWIASLAALILAASLLVVRRRRTQS